MIPIYFEKEGLLLIMPFSETVKIILFMAAVFISNIVQALTGFAGVMLSMPPTILLYGPDMAKAVINFICWLVGLVVMWQNRKYISGREWFKIILFMLIGMGLGMYLYNVIHAEILVPFYGAVIITAALKNLFFKQPDHLSTWIAIPVLLGAGIIHGMFASGGALLVIYLAATFKDKKYFRANVAAVWTVLNVVLMASDYEKGLFNQQFFELMGYSVIPLVAAVYLGNKAHDAVNQKTFNYITYGLLLLSGSMILI